MTTEGTSVQEAIRLPCWFHGRPVGCRNGDACPFSHEAEAIELRIQRQKNRRKDPPSNVTSPPQPLSQDEEEEQHEETPWPSRQWIVRQSSRRGMRQIPCVHFINAYCGDRACPYSHDARVIGLYYQNVVANLTAQLDQLRMMRMRLLQ